MGENERKEVVISQQFDSDLIDVYIHGEDVFGSIAAKSFIADIYSRVWCLDFMYYLHPECRHLQSKNKIYRNIILGSYLIIYRITSEKVEVLRIISGHISITKLKLTRKIRL